MSRSRKPPYRSRRRSVPCMLPLERRTLLSSAFIDPPAPPAVFLNTTYVPGSGATINVAAGGNVQSAINSAQLGDTIVLAAGATFSGNFTLPNKTTGSGWITIRSGAADSDLPAPGTRITPAHSSLMPKLVSNSSAYALSTTSGAHHYRFIGVEFTIGAAVTNNTGIVVLGSGTETMTSQIPHDLVFDRCYIHGNPTADVQNGMRLNSASTAVIDSYFDQCQASAPPGAGGFESHCIGGYNGPGPYKLVNNTFSSATIPVIFGGATTSISGTIPSDMEIRNNYFTRPRSWYPGDPNFVANDWYVKNLFELKNAQRVLFDGNVLEHNWPQAGSTVDGSAQAGYAMLLTVRDQSGAMPWATVQDITITNNVIRKSNVGISLYGVEGAGTKRIKIANNLFDDIGLNWGNNDRSGLFTQFQTVGDTEFNHNTIINDGDIMFANGTEVADLDFNNNIVNHNAKRTTNFNRGINGVGTGIGVPTLDAKFVQYLVTKNVMANASGGTYTGSAAGNFFPGSSATPGDFSSVGFTSLANRDYRLAAASAYNNAATDGTDIGANIDTLEATAGGAMTLATTGTSGNDTYYLKRNGNLLELYNNATGTGTPIQRDMFVYYEALTFDGTSGDDKLIIDYSGGNPVPAGGVFFDGGANSSGDTVQIIGNGAGATYTPPNVTGRGVITVAGGGGAVTMLNTESLTASNLANFTLVAPLNADVVTIDTPQAGQNRISHGPGSFPFPPATLSSSIPITIDCATNESAGGSADSITITPAANSSIRFIGGSGNDTMTLAGGSLTFNTDLGADSSALALTVNAGATAQFGANQNLRSLTINGLATMLANGGRSLLTKSLTISGGKLDLKDNKLVVDYSGASPIGTSNGSTYDGITGLIATGRNGGAWNGPSGIVTSTASGSLTGLGVAEVAGDVVVKFTYGGDANLDGKINIDDYGHIDTSIGTGVAGWFNGDFNYDGKINIDDYGIIDVNVGVQGPPINPAAPATAMAMSTAFFDFDGVSWDAFGDSDRRTVEDVL